MLDAPLNYLLDPSCRDGRRDRFGRELHPAAPPKPTVSFEQVDDMMSPR
jgi:hypothetical protein